MFEDRNFLFVRCHFYDKICYLVSRWLGFSTTTQGTLYDYLTQFGGLGGYSKSIRITLNIFCFMWFELFGRREIDAFFRIRMITCNL